MIKKLLIVTLILLPLQLYSKPNQQLSANFCELLGMLDEYISRFNYNTGIPIDSLVECFYPHEKELSEHFIEIISEFEKESQTTLHLTRKIGSQGHIYYYSKPLSEIINSYYKLGKNNLASLDKDLILKQDKESRVAYLKGVYLRFGEGNEISVANGLNKIETIIAIMKSLNINNVKLYRSKEEYIPYDYVITFTNSEYLDGIVKNSGFHSKLDANIYEQIEIK